MKKYRVLTILTIAMLFFFWGRIYYEIGRPIDSHNGIFVYYNGPISNVVGRNISKDGYNLGLKYQCVEFVKRYYYEHLNHKMPESFGHAKDFYDLSVKDGQKNLKRNLYQFANPSRSVPKEDDLIVFSGSPRNPYGHVAIVTKVEGEQLEIIQQNSGYFGKARVNLSLVELKSEKKYRIDHKRVVGWLRKE
ncbi:CHAP domain-containing protein [Leptospira weilii]|uniref:CHAP domain-containing protein n=1 Tax=Leptospira weilii TaxID=28184 RepID=UPI0002DE956D|nr:CHAP domain-containing protein [Leptospira weilii]